MSNIIHTTGTLKGNRTGSYTESVNVIGSESSNVGDRVSFSRKALASISFVTALMITGGGGNIALAKDITTGVTNETEVKEADTDKNLVVKGANGKVADVKFTTTSEGSITVETGSDGVDTNKNILIDNTAGGKITITNNSDKFLGGIKFGTTKDDGNSKAEVTINNTKSTTTGAADPKISGDIIGSTGEGKITINNGANGTLAGAITGKGGDIIIQNAGTIEGKDKKITSGNSNIVITNQATGNIKNEIDLTGQSAEKLTDITNAASGTIEADIKGGAGAVEITNSGEIKGTGKTITGGAGKLTITNNTGGSIAQGITGATGEAEINNSAAISGVITAGSGSMTINNNTGGSITNAVAGNDTGALIINNSGTLKGVTANGGDITITNNTSGNITDALTLKDKGGNLTFTNNGATFAAAFTITGGNGAVTITNATGGKLQGAITGGKQAVSITNAGEIAAKITTATDAAAESIITNEAGGKITDDIVAGGTGSLTITNSGDMTASANTKKIEGAGGNVTIDNKAGTISHLIDLSGKAGNLTITNAGTLSGATIKAGNDALAITNTAGTISGDITAGKKESTITNAEGATLSGSITAGDGGKLTIENAGTITGNTKTIKANGADLTITNLATGTIGNEISMDGKAGDLTIENAGTLNKITAGSGKLTINNTNAAKINADISGSTDDSKLTKIDNAGTISGAIDAKDGSFELTNTAGTISGAITAGGKASSISNTGTISGGISAGAGALTITNSGTISAGTATTAVKITGGAENLSITNQAGGTIAAAIEGTTGTAATNKTTTITNAGTISGAIDAKAGIFSLTNQTGGNITGAIAGGAGAFTLVNATGASISAINGGAGVVSVTNDGSVKVLTLQKAATGTNTITNQANGVITDIKFTAATGSTDPITATINNAGKINRLEFNSAATVTLGAKYNVVVNDKGSYDSNGVLGIGGTKSNATLIIAHENAFALSFGENFDAGAVYSLANFVDGGDREAKLKYTDGGENVTLSSGHITTTQNIFEIEYVPLADGGIGFTGTVQANKSIGSLGAVQTTANMNAQIGRVQTLMDGVFDSLSTGEIGYGITTEPSAGSVQMQQASASKVKGGYVMLAAAGSPNAVAPNLTLSQNNKKWVGFVTPYYSASNIRANGFTSAAGTSAGFIGGAARIFDNGLLVGVHLGAESQMAGNVNNEMRSQGGSFMLGASAKIPFAKYDFGAVKLTPLVKVQGTGMGAVNSYMLTPLQDVTREATGVVGGFSISALAGVDVHTNYGYLAPELGLMQQVVNMPTLQYSGFNSSSNDQVINGSSVTPFSLVAQLRYVKDFQVGKVGLYPAIKGGVRYVMVGGSYTTSIFLPTLGNSWYGTNSVDSVVGVAEVGLGVKFGSNVAVNLSYGGEFGSQVTTHNLSLRSGWQF